MSEIIEGFLSTLAAYVIGTAVSAIVLGYMLDRFVIKKIFRNKKIQRLEGQLDKILDKLDELTEKKTDS